MKIYFGVYPDGHHGFFHEGIQSPDLIPKGAVEITAAQHKELLSADTIAVNPDGTPRAVKISLDDLPPPHKAMVALAQGLQITSESCPAVNGTYACNDQAVTNVLNAAMHLKVYGVFPGARGILELQWPDKAGVPHQFADQALFLAFSAAVSNYNALLKQVINKTSTTLPPNSVGID
jgi:hypothetical protein